MQENFRCAHNNKRQYFIDPFLIIKSNQITFIVFITKYLGEWNSWERAPDSAKKQFTYRQYIFTDCTEDNVQKSTYTYSVHTVYYKDILSYQYTLYTVCTHSTLCTHLYIVIYEGATDYTLYNRLVVRQIVVQRCNRLYICNVVDVLLYGVQW